ncbi:MAG TPA: thiolase family protein, partial [Solirubrobacterales bacterium]|nr:thiolase family protein [Solirubrobacterales bacterium]
MNDAFIVDAVRTPMGRYRGVLAGVRPDDLAARTIAAAVERTGLDPEGVGDVYWGAANQSGEDNRDAGRMASLLAGLPVEVPGITVNRLCASGLEAVNQASRALRLGEGDLYLAGGAESMSRAPWVMLKPEAGLPRGPQTMHDTALGWRLINPRMAERYSTESMGETGENVAERYRISRSEQDRFALQSHMRAVAATGEGRFADELLPIEAPPPNGRGEAKLVEVDEGPRADTSLEKLGKLRPAFREGGTVTAGNASTLNDGAACLVLASGGRAEAMGAEPLARIVSIGVAGVDPAYMGVGPIPAIRRAVDAANLSLDEVDLVEINEAFASQVLACIGELGIEEER